MGWSNSLPWHPSLADTLHLGMVQTEGSHHWSCHISPANPIGCHTWTHSKTPAKKRKNKSAIHCNSTLKSQAHALSVVKFDDIWLNCFFCVSQPAYAIFVGTKINRVRKSAFLSTASIYETEDSSLLAIMVTLSSSDIQTKFKFTLTLAHLYPPDWQES